MNNVIPFRQPRQAHDQACRWLALLDKGASEEELARFGEWLAEDPANAAAFVKAASLWDDMNALAELAQVFPLESFETTHRTSRGRRRFMAASSVLALGLAAGFFSAWRRNRREGQWSFSTEVGEQSAANLRDGSELVLNTNTLVHVTYLPDERKVHLVRGEALFTVAPDASRPFRVYAGNRVVEAVGTAFTVHRSPQEAVEVLVTEGRVNFLQLSERLQDRGDLKAEEDSGAARPLSLNAGEYAAVASGDGERVETKQIEQEEMRARLAWREGMLLFQGDSLQHVVDEVSRYTLVRIEADPSVRDIVVRGYFRAGDVEGLLVVMRENFQIQAQVISDDHIVLVGNPQEDTGPGTGRDAPVSE